MSPTPSSAPAPLVIRYDRGKIRKILLGVALVGAGLAGLGIYQRYLAPLPGDLARGILPLIFGIAGIVVGLPVATLVWKLTIDRSAGEIVLRNGILGFVRTRRHSLQQFDKVVLGLSKTFMHVQFAVHVAGSEWRLLLTEHLTREEAATKASEIAEYLGFKVFESADWRNE